jgi:hypothetical protein
MDNNAFDDTEAKNFKYETDKNDGLTHNVSTIETFAGQLNQIGNTILGPAAKDSFEPLYFPNTELFRELRGL